MMITGGNRLTPEQHFLLLCSNEKTFRKEVLEHHRAAAEWLASRRSTPSVFRWNHRKFHQYLEWLEDSHSRRVEMQERLLGPDLVHASLDAETQEILTTYGAVPCQLCADDPERD